MTLTLKFKILESTKNWKPVMLVSKECHPYLIEHHPDQSGTAQLRKNLDVTGYLYLNIEVYIN